MQFLSTFLKSIRVWQVFGMMPFAFSEKSLRPEKSSVYSIMSAVWTVFHVIIFVHGLIYTGYYVDWDQKKWAINDFLTLNMVRFIAILVVIESWMKRTLQTEFFDKIAKVDSILSYKLNIDINYELNQREMTFKLFAWISMIVALQVISATIFYFIGFDKFTVLLWAHLLPFAICSLRYQQMIVYARLLGIRFILINAFIRKNFLFDDYRGRNSDFMKTMKNLTKVKMFSTDEEIIVACKKLMELRLAYQQLLGTSETITEMFGWTLPLNLANDFQKALINTYLMISLALRVGRVNASLEFMIAIFLWLLVNMTHIVTISHSCQRTCEEAQLTPALLHDIKFDEEKQEIADLVCGRSFLLLNKFMTLFLRLHFRFNYFRFNAFSKRSHLRHFIYYKLITLWCLR